MSDRFLGSSARRISPSVVLIVLAALGILLLIGSKFIASTAIDYSWWTEMGQVDTWVNLLIYSTMPVVLAVALLFACFWTSYVLGIRRGSEDSGRPAGKMIQRIAFGVLVILAIGVANATVDNWTVARFFGGMRVPAASAGFADPVFGLPLRFYFFELPFYSLLLRVVLTGTVLSLVIYWLAAHLHKLRGQFPNLPVRGVIDLDDFALGGSFDSSFVRVVLAILLAGISAKLYFSRYDLLLQDHGSYLVGIDWVAAHIALPLQWALIVSALVAAVLVLVRRWRWALVLLLMIPVRLILPPIVASIYVRPNELTLQRPYIEHHIEATRSAYGLDSRMKEGDLEAKPEISIDYAKHKALLDNVRLWDWRAFHDTVSQIQPLRPYIYLDTDVDRYQIDGQLRQILISPRELDIRQLGEARTSWINPHFVYTHGYGIVMAEANRITSDGLPLLFIKNAPAEVSTKSLKLTKPEIYYGEVAHEPVFVDTDQPEFNYPSGEKNVHTTYGGTGGFEISSWWLRLASAIDFGDFNILLTNNFKPTSRMMIRRQIVSRISTLAGFVTWDADPYLVLDSGGRLVWMIDGYMASASHPYSREMSFENGETFNYLRNSVKATVDAYTGETNFYVFDAADPLIQAYWKLFPQLFKPASAMPKDLRAHARYPETLFRAQAEIYRTFHMRDPEAFYNRADLWDIAKTSTKQQNDDSNVKPTYVVATLPGEDEAQFLLIIPFTPANKDNLIGFMAARCDGEHLGELVVKQLSKQNIIFGPMQIEARINQDQNISKDLTLWNQQGSEVLRGQTLVLPIENTFLYVAPIYIQASQGKMPQLKKVALAMGNRLAYADTYEQALTQLIGQNVTQTETQTEADAGAAAPKTSGAPNQTAAPGAPSSEALRTLTQIRDHLRRYRELNGQGKWAEAGKELEQVDKLLNGQP